MAVLKTHRFETLRLLVLIPHRDAQLPLRTWSGSLFAAGIEGAWSFPWVAPVATLSRPAGEGELRCLARLLRKQIMEQTKDGKIRTGPIAAAILPGYSSGGIETAITGPTLDIEISVPFFADGDIRITHHFAPLIVGAALIGESPPGDLRPADLLPPPSISFRAAALANMSFRPLSATGNAPDGCSGEWNIGKLYWLPAAGRQENR